MLVPRERGWAGSWWGCPGSPGCALGSERGLVDGTAAPGVLVPLRRFPCCLAVQQCLSRSPRSCWQAQPPPRPC